MKKLTLVLVGLSAACSTVNVFNDAKNLPLVTVGEEQIMTEEFIYAFSKNRPADSTTSKEEVDEYLDLYINFKLKVAEATRRGMDTTAAFLKEYNSYIDQLDNSYLQSGNDTEELILEAYDRLQFEIRASHILFLVEESASPQDTLEVYNKALAILDSINSGADFGSMASQYSEDPSAKKNKGDLGYFTVFQMVYPFETAAYNTDAGGTSLPTRTKFGFHLIKVVDKRPNEGKVKVAHIMIRKKEGDKARAFTLYNELMAGGNWDDLCRQNSEDAQTANQGGVLANFSRNQIVPEFAEAAFNLTLPEEISDPVETAYGWHIIKLIEQIPVGDFEANRKQLSAQVRRDSRSQISRIKMLERLSLENNFVQNSDNVQIIVLPENHKFLKNKWLLDEDTLSDLELFKIGQRSYIAEEYYNQIKKTTTHQESKSFLFDQYKIFKEQSLINYEKEHLSEKHPEYQFLKREYHDGILLFSIMEEEVWAKAGKDSLGLEEYYEENKLSFIDTTKLSAAIFSSREQNVIDSISLLVPNSESFITMSREEKEALLTRFNQQTQLSLQLDSGSYTIREHPVLKNIDAPYTSVEIEMDGMRYYVLPLRDPKLPVPIEEIKGSLIADYQEVLESRWLVQLTSTYDVEINKGILKKVYRELEVE